MKKNEIMKHMGRTISKVGFKIRKKSPELLLVAGFVAGAVGVVSACRATLKVDDILAEAKKNAENVHKMAENPEVESEYTEQDCKRAIAVNYAQTGLRLAKLYAPAITMGAVSVGCILASNNIMKKRNAALAAAYATVEKGFKEYRNRVVERYGDEAEREIRYGVDAKEVEETTIDENGEEKTETKTVNVTDVDASPFARFFDAANPNWQKDPEYNMMFLKAEQSHANDLLKRDGYLFLNDVYKALGLEPSKAGQVIGWIYDENNPVGDNFVDFGIFNGDSEATRRFVNGYENTILLDFNVDGNIWDMM